jgi:Major intrinsic protein
VANQVPLARILRDSALELLLTFCMLFGVTTIVRWVIGPSPISRLLPEIHAELLIVGLAVAILIAGLILSPPGRTTGGHMNPAISLAMWRFGVFPGVGVVPYIVAQLLGSVLGVCGSSRGMGPGCGRASGGLRSAAARTRLVIDVTFRNGSVKYGGHRSSGRSLSGRAQACAIRALDCRRSDRPGDCDTGYLDWGQPESGAPVRAGCSFGTDSLPLGVSARANGGGAARDMGPRDSPAPPICTHTQTMRHSPRRQLVVKLKDEGVPILRRDRRLK